MAQNPPDTKHNMIPLLNLSRLGGGWLPVNGVVSSVDVSDLFRCASGISSTLELACSASFMIPAFAMAHSPAHTTVSPTLILHERRSCIASAIAPYHVQMPDFLPASSMWNMRRGSTAPRAAVKPYIVRFLYIYACVYV